MYITENYHKGINGSEVHRNGTREMQMKCDGNIIKIIMKTSHVQFNFGSKKQIY